MKLKMKTYQLTYPQQYVQDMEKTYPETGIGSMLINVYDEGVIS